MLCPDVYGQRELKFEIINQTRGLSANSVSSILQDSQGFMWFGTRDGLNVYDGVRTEVVKFSEKNNIISCIFEAKDSTLWIGIVGLGLVHYDPRLFKWHTHSSVPEDPDSLSTNTVTFIQEDKTGKLWISTNLGGFDVFDPTTEKFEKFYHDPNNTASLSSNNVTHFFEDDLGRIIIGTDDGQINIFNRDEKGFVRHPLEYDVQQTINDIHKDINGNVWIAGSKGLYQVDIKHENSVKIRKWSKIPTGSTFWEGENQELWLGAEEKLYSWNRNTNDFVFRGQFQIEKTIPAIIDKTASVYTPEYMYQINAKSSPVLMDVDGRFWMITNKGVNVFDPVTGAGNTVRSDDDFTNFSSDQVNTIIKDNSGSIWFGTIGGGVIKYYGSNFKHYQFKRRNHNSLGGQFVLNFTEEEDSKIWVGTNGGSFSLFDPVSETFERFKIPGSESIIFQVFPDGNNLWLATSSDGLVKFDRKSKSFVFNKKSQINNTGISSNNVQRILDAGNGSFWIGTDNGLNKFQKDKGEFALIDLSDNTGVQPDIFAMHIDGDYLWIGTQGQGIINLNLNDLEDYTIYKYDPEITSSLNNNFITSIYPDPDDSNIVWFGSYGGGLQKFQRDSKEFQSFTIEDGLPNNVIYGILEDEEDNIWVSTNAGLTKFNKSLEQVVANYEVYDGLQANEFNRGAYLKTRDGHFLFGGINGFNYFLPQDIGRREFSPPVVITSFRIYGTEDTDIVSKIRKGSSDIGLKYDQNFISIEFAALDFRNSNRNEYRYKLDGLEEEWRDVRLGNPVATYTNLDPGDYQFQLLASNSDGVWMESMKVLDITISPPFWASWWFRFLMALTAIGVVATFHFSRIRILESQRRKLNELVNQRTKIIFDQNNKLSENNKELSRKADELNSAYKEISLRNEELNEALGKLRRTQGQLIESEKMASLGVLSAGVGHEINNPLNFIKNGIEGLSQHLIRKKMVKDSVTKKFVDVIEEGVGRASSIVRSLSHFSRVNTDMDEECDLHQILDNCLVILHNRLKHKVNTVKKYTSKSVVRKGNEGRLHQALINILTNAEQAIVENGVITIETQAFKDQIMIKVSDNGVGISKANIKKIMDPFFTTKEPGEGTGLGLAISYKIIEEHGGKIEVSSEITVGTTFIVYLPMEIG